MNDTEKLENLVESVATKLGIGLSYAETAKAVAEIKATKDQHGRPRAWTYEDVKEYFS